MPKLPAAKRQRAKTAKVGVPLREDVARPDRDAALQLARRRFAASRRVDAGDIADTLGVNRATLYRWFGGRDELLIETLWSLCKDEMVHAQAEARGKGIELLIDGMSRFVTRITESQAYRHFLRTEPEAAARALFTAPGSIRQRITAVTGKLARQYAGLLAGRIEPEPLAMAVVRVGEAFLYGDHIGNGTPNVADLIRIYRLLLSPLQSQNSVSS